MPTVTVNPVNTIKVRVGTTNQPVVSTTTQFLGSGSAQQIAQEALNEANNAYAAANAAYEYANSAYLLANNKVSRSGDTMTDALYFQTNSGALVGVGNILDANAIELYAGPGAGWAELNYANTNYVYVDAVGSYLQSNRAMVNAFGDGTVQLATSNGKSMSVIVGSTPVFEVASNNDVFSTGTYFGVIDKVDGGIFS
jgi:hypothetical protein